MNQQAVDQIKSQRDGWIAAVQDRDAVIKQFLVRVDALAAENKVLREAISNYERALVDAHVVGCVGYSFWKAARAALTKEATNG
jgi:hypothetical protein